LAKPTIYSFQLFADYFQLYIRDATAIDEIDTWSEDDIANLLVVAPGIIGIGTMRNMITPFTVAIYEQPPQDNISEWQHIIEASMEIPSGILIISGCSDYLPDSPRIQVKLGTYRVRSYARGLDTLSSDGLEGNDEYQVALWPAPFHSLQIIKRFR
jgi:hypothetical protein